MRLGPGDADPDREGQRATVLEEEGGAVRVGEDAGRVPGAGVHQVAGGGVENAAEGGGADGAGDVGGEAVQRREGPCG